MAREIGFLPKSDLDLAAMKLLPILTFKSVFSMLLDMDMCLKSVVNHHISYTLLCISLCVIYEFQNENTGFVCKGILRDIGLN